MSSFFHCGVSFGFWKSQYYVFIKKNSFISEDQGNSCSTYDPFNDAAHLFINQSDSKTLCTALIHCKMTEKAV